MSTYWKNRKEARERILSQYGIPYFILHDISENDYILARGIGNADRTREEIKRKFCKKNVDNSVMIELATFSKIFLIGIAGNAVSSKVSMISNERVLSIIADLVKEAISLRGCERGRYIEDLGIKSQNVIALLYQGGKMHG